MDQQPIQDQIVSLEAQVSALRDAFDALPLGQREAAGADLERAQAAMAALRDALSAVLVEAPAVGAGGGRNEDPVVWSAERTTRLYAINTALSVAMTQAEAAEVVVNQALPALMADAGLVLIASSDEILRPVDADEGAKVGEVTGVPIDGSSPFGQAALAAEAVWIQTQAGLASRYPVLAGTTWASAGAMGVVPLISQGRVLGVLAFRFDVARSFTISDRAFMLVLAQQCAAAFERADLYERVRRAAASEERNRLARDLHDSVSQALYAITLTVTAARSNLARDLGVVARALDSIESLTASAHADLRALLFDLHAESVTHLGLVNALAERAQFIRLRYSVEVRLELCDEPSLRPPCKDALYGIAREAMHNAAKHAQAKTINLRLAQVPEGLLLEIGDDGVGFEPGPPRPGHYGIKSMRDRASELGAQLRIESVRGQGTRVVTFLRVSAFATGEQGSLSC